MRLSSVARLIIASFFIVSAAAAQTGPDPVFTYEDLEFDGPYRNAVTSCDDPALRTDLDVSASQATCDTCPGGQSATDLTDTYNDTGDPVLLHNGAVSYRATDLFIPGRGINFEMTRRYNSKRAADESVMGWGWEFAYDQRIIFTSSPAASGPLEARLKNGNNRLDRYSRASASGDLWGEVGLYTRLYQLSSTQWVLRARHGSRSYFELDTGAPARHTYRLYKVEDASGNSLTIAYASSQEIQTITDSLGRAITFTYSTSGPLRLLKVADFDGREVEYSYDSNDDLVAVRSPTVTSTGGFNDFSSGRTETYEYDSSHRLTKIIKPRENAASLTTPYVTFAYHTSGSWWQGWVASQTLGGNTIDYFYTTNATLPTGYTGLAPVSMLTQVTDRNNNITLYWFNPGGQVVLKEEHMGSSVYHRTSFTYNADGELLTKTMPRGNVETRTYHTGPTRISEGNLASITHSIGSAADLQPGYDSFTTYYEWDPVFGQLLSRSDPRNSAWKTTFVLDYMEGYSSDPDYVVEIVDALLNTVPDVSGTEALLDGLGVLDADVNGDGRGGSEDYPSVSGLVIQRIEPTVDLSQSIGVDNQAAAEGDDSQEAITTWTYNDHGQVTSQTDAEENVTLFAYTPADDLDADGLGDVTGITAVTTTGGMPRQTISDVALPYSATFASQFSSLVSRALGTDIGRNVGPGPGAAAVSRVADYYYNTSRYLVAYVDGRGVRHDMSVNELGETWKVERGTDTSVAASRQGGAPEETTEAHIASTSFGYETLTAYDANGQVVSIKVTDSVGASGNDGYWEEQYEYDVVDNLRFSHVEKAGGQFVTTEAQYDPNENVVKIITPLGNYTRLEYDARDQVVAVFKSPAAVAEEQIESRDYDANGNPIEFIDGNANRTEYVYDEFDRVHSILDPIGNERINTFDEASNVVLALAKMEPAGGGTATGLRSMAAHYDQRSRLWRTDFAPEDGSSITDGALSSDGKVNARFDYDRLSRLTFRTEDDAQVYESHYDGLGRRVWTRDPIGNVQTGSFDDESNLVKVTETDVYPSAAPTRTFWTWRRYDALGREISFTNQLGETQRRTYDARDLMIAASDAEAPGSSGTINGVSVNPPGNTRGLIYDGRGLLLSETIDLRVGGVGTGAIDTSNLANADGKIVLQQSWDDEGRLWKRTDDNGNATEYVLDHRGRAVEEIFADSTKIERTFDSNGNLATVEDARGNLSSYTFDPLDRLTSVQLISGPSTSIGAQSIAFTLDGFGRRVQTSNSYKDGTGTPQSVVFEREWDAFDRLTKEADVASGREINATWREERKRTSVEYPSVGWTGTHTVGYVYDALDRVQKIQTTTSTGTPVTTDLAVYDYAGTNRKIARTLRNRAYTRWHDGSFGDSLYVDGARRTTAFEHVHLTTSALLGSFEHAYDRMGFRKWERRAHDSDQGDNYGHDSLYRLTAFERRVPTGDIGTLGQGNDESDSTWQLDGVHNWIGFTLDAVSSPSTVDNVNNYTSYGSQSPVYDLEGNMVSPDSGGNVSMQFDFLNRLVQVSDATGLGTSLDHFYDAEGRRVSTLFNGSAGALLQRDYVYDKWDVIEEHDLTDSVPSGSPVWSYARRYVLGADTDEPLSMEVRPGIAGVQFYYFLQSTLGHVTALVSQSGVVVERYSYDAYGAPRFEDANSAPHLLQRSNFGNPYLFSGRRYEPWLLSLYEYRHRFYNPLNGQFLQRDPLGMWADELSIGNSRTYGGLSPLDVLDPSGLQGILAGAAGAGGMALAGGATVSQAAAAAVGVLTGPVGWIVIGVTAVVVTVQLTEVLTHGPHIQSTGSRKNKMPKHQKGTRHDLINLKKKYETLIKNKRYGEAAKVRRRIEDMGGSVEGLVILLPMDDSVPVDDCVRVTFGSMGGKSQR